jgi:hypothetical protein
LARITSDFWVSAHLRLCALNGIDAVLRRRGAAEAGAIFVALDRLDGSADLYGPAPPSFDGEERGGRVFAPVLRGATPLDIEARMQRELKFDPDLWWIAIDDREGRSLLDITGTDGAA